MTLVCDFPVEHYNYDVLDNPYDPCPCVLCVRARETILTANLLLIPDMHAPARCRCVACTQRKRADAAALEAINRRTVYSELSWLVRRQRWAPGFLQWLWIHVADLEWRPEMIVWRPNWDAAKQPKRSVRSWWMYETENKILASWIEDWAQTQDVMVSAATVLRDRNFTRLD